jgi:hypothetical protein
VRRAAALVVTAVLLAGCGGDDDAEVTVTEPSTAATSAPPQASTEAFASGVCGAITTFSGQARALNEALEVSDDPGETVDALVETYGRMATVVDGLVGQVRTTPAPAVEGGEEIKAAVVAAYEDMAGVVHGIVDDLEAVPEGDEAAAADAVEEVGTTFGEALDRITAAVGEVATDHPEATEELDEAFATEHECVGLTTE